MFTFQAFSHAENQFCYFRIYLTLHECYLESTAARVLLLSPDYTVLLNAIQYSNLQPLAHPTVQRLRGAITRNRTRDAER